VRPLKFTLSLFILAFALSAQSTVPVTTTTALPNNWVGAWASWDGRFGGGASYATLISGKGQVYSFTSYMQTVAPTKPFKLLNSTETGLAMLMRQMGPISLFAFAQGGQTNNGTTVSASFSGGGLVTIRLGKTNWDIAAAIQPSTSGVTGQMRAYKLGLGRIW
jgi:hypothetical protein